MHSKPGASHWSISYKTRCLTNKSDGFQVTLPSHKPRLMLWLANFLKRRTKCWKKQKKTSLNSKSLFRSVWRKVITLPDPTFSTLAQKKKTKSRWSRVSRLNWRSFKIQWSASIGSIVNYQLSTHHFWGPPSSAWTEKIPWPWSRNQSLRRQLPKTTSHQLSLSSLSSSLSNFRRRLMAKTTSTSNNSRTLKEK